MNADGSNQQLLASLGTFAPCYDRPTYSPDGAKIIFGLSLDCGTTHKSISTINADGSNFVQSGFGRFPTYSPDGLKIASVCCYFEPSNNPPRMSSYNVSGGSNLTYPKTLSASDETLPDWQGFRVPHVHRMTLTVTDALTFRFSARQTARGICFVRRRVCGLRNGDFQPISSRPPITTAISKPMLPCGDRRTVIFIF